MNKYENIGLHPGDEQFEVDGRVKKNLNNFISYSRCDTEMHGLHAATHGTSKGIRYGMLVSVGIVFCHSMRERGKKKKKPFINYRYCRSVRVNRSHYPISGPLVWDVSRVLSGVLYKRQQVETAGPGPRDGYPSREDRITYAGPSWR